MRSRKGGGAMDLYRALVKSMNQAGRSVRSLDAWSHAMRKSLASGSAPHEGPRERGRRCRQIEAHSLRRTNRGTAGVKP